MQIGCTTRPYQALSLNAACEHIAAAGFTEVALFYNHTPDGPAIAVDAHSSRTQIVAARHACSDAGLLPSMLLAGEWPAALSHDAAVEQYRRLINHAAQLGAHMLLDFGCEHAASLPAYLALMQAIDPIARAAQITICIKPHGGIATHPMQLLALKDILQSDAFMLSFDPGNLLYYSTGKIQPTNYVAALAPYCANLIIKDYQLTAAGPSVAITPGDGEVDFPALFREFAAQRFCGPCYLEMVAGETLEQIDHHVRLSLRRIQTWLAASQSSITEFTP
jgi:sugar phosphate isomerase/epimerase